MGGHFWPTGKHIRAIDWWAIEHADYPPVTDSRRRRLAKRMRAFQ